jgi:ATP-binding cassette subfamily B protein
MKNFGTSAYTQEAKLNVIKYLLPHLWPKNNWGLKFRLILSLLCVVLGKLVAVWVPFFYKKAVDVFDSADTQLIAVPVFFLVAYGFSRGLSTGLIELKEAVFSRVEQRAVRSVALTVFRHLHNLSMRFHMDRQTGSVTRSLERGTKAIETFFRFSTFNIIPTFIEIFLVLITVYYFYSWYFTILIGFGIFLYIYFTLKITHWRAQFVRKMNEEDNTSNNKAIESLINFETVKYFGNEEHEYARYDKAQELYEDAAVRNKFGLALLNSGQAIIISITLITALLACGYHVYEGNMTLGDLVLINTYLMQLFAPLYIFGFAYREVKRSLVEMEHMFGLLNEPIEILDKEDANDIQIKEGNVSFKDVVFSYNPEREILHGISFSIPAGKKIAIVGSSGSGKSTISRLLYRFYDVNEGSIEIDGFNIKDISQKSLRKEIAVVPQDMVLFNESIFYNIQYGRPEATPEEIYQAAKYAHLTDFIESLPLKYDTVVGERGLKLSGGEKQRVAIARALLKKPRIFLFDEATSSLDTKTEKEIQENLNQISKNHTTLIIAHRLSTVIDADQILVLEKGHILERGTHKELLKKKGHYYNMWQRQSNEKTPD